MHPTESSFQPSDAPKRFQRIPSESSPSSTPSTPQIFNYLDYREFLRDFYLFKKQENKSYSYALFSQRAGIKSPNYLKLVMEGARNVTSDSILGFARALGLNDLETIYWENLVALNQAKTEEQRRYYLVKLVQSPLPDSAAQNSKIRFIRDEWDYYSSWHAAAIRELALRPDFVEEPSAISRLLKNRLTPAEAKAALELLIRLKFLVRGEDGRLRQAEKTVCYYSAEDLANLFVRQFHRSTAELALTSLDEDPPGERDFSGLTISIRAGDLPRLKKKLADFRAEVVDQFTRIDLGEDVLQINFQVIPLTRREEKAR